MNHSENSRINLVLMAKAPRPGCVKTRLQKAFSPQQACDIYAQFLVRVKALAESWQTGRANLRRFIAYDPPDQPKFWHNWPEWTKLPQSTGDLGSRMLAVIQTIAPGPSDAIIFIGADAPELSLSQLDWALEQLVSNDAVVIPADDGGYVLIGMHASAQTLLMGIPWSTECVLAQTRKNADAAGLKLTQCAPMSDVDTAEDLAGLIARLLCSSDESDKAMAGTLKNIVTGERNHQ
jgi:rSAM/selenodomain-associated transferase 1